MAKLWNEANLTPASFVHFRSQLANFKGVKKTNRISFGKFYKKLEAFLSIEAPDKDKEIADRLVEFVELEDANSIDLDSLEMFVRI